MTRDIPISKYSLYFVAAPKHSLSQSGVWKHFFLADPLAVEVKVPPCGSFFAAIEYYFNSGIHMALHVVMLYFGPWASGRDSVPLSR